MTSKELKALGKRDDTDLSGEQLAALVWFEQSVRWVEATANELMEAVLSELPRQRR